MHALSNGSAGARSIADMVTVQGIPLSRYRAGRCMKQLGLVSGQVPAHRYKKADQPHVALPIDWIDSPIERFFRSLKTEWVPETGYRSFEEAKARITDHIFGYYNRFRPHKNNDSLPPAVTEEKYWNAQSTVATFT